MQLYKINQEIEKLLNAELVDEETGEILNEGDYEELEKLELEQGVKIENTACFIKNLLSDVEQLKAEETALRARRTAKERKAERLTAYLESNLLESGQEKFETPKCSIKFSKSKRVIIQDEKEFLKNYPRYKKEKVTVSADKVGIKKAIKNGDNFNGLAKMQTFKNINIK